MNVQLLLLVFFMIWGFISMITSILAYAQISGFANDFSDIIDTWEVSPITDITTAVTSCPEGYTQVNNVIWGGTYDACECERDRPAYYYSSSLSTSVTFSTGNTPTTYDYDGRCDNITLTTSPTQQCNEDELYCGCWNRRGWTPISMRMRNEALCVKRSGPSAIERERDYFVCRDTAQICGDEDFSFCWPANEPCPVTDLVFVASTSNVSPPTNADSTVSYNSGTLYLKRGGLLETPLATRGPYTESTDNPTDSLPLTGFPITDLNVQSNFVCTLSTTACGYSGRSYSSMEMDARDNTPWGYKLKGPLCTGCPKPDVDGIESISPNGLDKRFVLVDHVPESQLFAENGVPVDFVTDNSMYNFFLQYRTEARWMFESNNACPSRYEVSQNEDEVRRVSTYQMVLLILCIFSFFIITIGYGYMKYAAKRDDREMDPDTKKNCNRCKYSFKLCTYGFMIATIVVCYAVAGIFKTLADKGVDRTQDFATCTDFLSLETFGSLEVIFEGLSMKNYINGASQTGDIITEAVAGFMGSI